MRCIAHRGFAGVNAENTVPAVLAAARAGADCVEVDVRRCGTGEVVVCHDATVDRVADSSGRVDALSRTALADLDVLGSGAGVPTLRTLLDALPAGVGINVELKERGLGADVAALLAGTSRDALVSSFDPEALAELADTGPARALLVGSPGPDSDGGEAARRTALERASALGCAAIHPHHAWCERPFVDAAHERGLAVNAWTVRDRDVATALARAGVDGLIADDPRLCPG